MTQGKSDVSPETPGMGSAAFEDLPPLVQLEEAILCGGICNSILADWQICCKELYAASLSKASPGRLVFSQTLRFIPSDRGRCRVYHPCNSDPTVWAGRNSNCLRKAVISLRRELAYRSGCEDSRVGKPMCKSVIKHFRWTCRVLQGPVASPQLVIFLLLARYLSLNIRFQGR